MNRAQLSDKFKLRFLEQIRAEKEGNPKSYIDYERCEADIIGSLNSVQLREELLGEIQGGGRRARIIAGFDEATIEKYIDSIEDEDLLSEILRSPNVSDEFREKYASRIPNSYWWKCCIWKESDDKTIEKHLPEIIDEDVDLMITYFKSDELKEKYLKEIENEKQRSEIISSFKSDELKLKYLGDIQDKNARARIIASLIDENKKESYLTEFQENEYCRAKIVASFKTDELKLKYLPTIESDSEKADIIASLEDDSKKVSLAKKLGREYQLMIMSTVKDENIRLKFLYSKVTLNDFFARDLDVYCFKLLNSFGNYREKARFLSLIPLEHASKLVAGITGEEKDFPAETIEMLGEDTVNKEPEEKNLEGLSIEELRAIQESNEETIKNNEEQIERQQLLNTIAKQRAQINKQNGIISELSQDQNKEKVGGSDE